MDGCCPALHSCLYFIVAAISSEWWGGCGSRGRAPGQGVRGQSHPEAEKKLNFDNTKPV